MPDYQLHLGDNLATLKTYPDNHFDSIVTDPPYGIEFLGKDWDKHTGTLDLYRECLRVLKPGGYLLAFSAARTYHQLASNIELAGFEIRDQLMWLYSSGFPKAQDIGRAIQKRLGVEEFDRVVDTTKNAGFGQTDHARVRAGVEWSTQAAEVGVAKCTNPKAQQWEGFKTALKPAHEPIVMARKPFRGSTIDNVLKNGLGAMNIDATRVPWADDKDAETVASFEQTTFANKIGSVETIGTHTYDRRVVKGGSEKKERKPFTKETFDGQTGFKDRIGADETTSTLGRYPSNVIGEVAEGYQKYFYCPKVSRKERHVGFDDPGEQTRRARDENGNTLNYAEKIDGVSPTMLAERLVNSPGNNHPTVKPVALMDYLIKLVTPPSTPDLQRKVLDPFMGSGSTGMAATALGHHFTGCDLDPNYVKIAKTRIEAWNQDTDTDSTTFDDLFE